MQLANMYLPTRCFVGSNCSPSSFHSQARANPVTFVFPNIKAVNEALQYLLDNPPSSTASEHLDRLKRHGVVTEGSAEEKAWLDKTQTPLTRFVVVKKIEEAIVRSKLHLEPETCVWIHKVRPLDF